MAETTGRFSDEFMEVRERVGAALHDAFHPAHAWSGCSNPDLVYEWMNRLADHLIDVPGSAEAWVAFGEEYDRRTVPA